MAYSRSFSGWRYRYRYGSRSSRRWRSGSRRRATGNAIAAKHQRDAATVTINRIGTYTVSVPINTSSGATSYNLWNELRLSEFYSNYAPMYDQVKMDKVRLKLTGFRAGSAQTDNISPSVVLAFDRNGLDPNQQITASAVATYSSAQLKQWSNGNSFTMYQTIYPSTIMEKGQYIPTGSLANPATVTASSNPCSPSTDPTLPFKPMSLIAVDLGANVAAAQTFAFTVEFEFTVTFRGMRKPSLSSSAVLVPLEVDIDSNDTYIYNPEDYEADGFSSVTINANFDTVVDSLSVYSAGSDGNFSLLRNYNSSDLNFTRITQSTQFALPSGYVRFEYSPAGLTLPGPLTVGALSAFSNFSSTDRTLTRSTGYMSDPIPITIPSGTVGLLYSLNSGSDTLFYMLNVNVVSYDSHFIYVDDDDILPFLN